MTRLKKKTDNRLTFEDLVAKSSAMRQVFRLGERAAQSNIPILIEGESGVGKELIARAIQGSSDRSGRPFVTVNCGAIPENLIESILFGTRKVRSPVRPTSISANSKKPTAATLFLDEIGELRIDMQVKLLRALQEGEVDPVGSKRPVKVDVRIVSATNRDLAELTREGRVSRRPLLSPQRLPDRHSTAARSSRRHSGTRAPLHRAVRRRRTQRCRGMTPEASDLLERFAWPGNVRQLENTIFRAVVLCDGSQLDVCDFPQIAAAMGRRSAHASCHARCARLWRVASSHSLATFDVALCPARRRWRGAYAQARRHRSGNHPPRDLAL
ncbi:MAG: sigma 54-interacting transcriptional regulator [Rhizomicrobium sp.]